MKIQLKTNLQLLISAFCKIKIERLINPWLYWYEMLIAKERHTHNHLCMLCTSWISMSMSIHLLWILGNFKFFLLYMHKTILQKKKNSCKCQWTIYFLPFLFDCFRYAFILSTTCRCWDVQFLKFLLHYFHITLISPPQLNPRVENYKIIGAYHSSIVYSELC